MNKNHQRSKSALSRIDVRKKSEKRKYSQYNIKNNSYKLRLQLQKPKIVKKQILRRKSCECNYCGREV